MDENGLSKLTQPYCHAFVALNVRVETRLIPVAADDVSDRARALLYERVTARQCPSAREERSMGSAETLRRDRARVDSLFKLFDETDDVRAKTAIMDETLATIEGHRGKGVEIAYVLHGSVSQRRYNWQRFTDAFGQTISPRLICLSQRRNYKTLDAGQGIVEGHERLTVSDTQVRALAD
jgi:hypothetical protein